MGCKLFKIDGAQRRTIRKPKPWKHHEPLTRARLLEMRDNFWFKAPFYGGRKDIWNALRAAAEENDLTKAQAILDSKDIIVMADNMTEFYVKDEEGTKGAYYRLPKYVLASPTNCEGVPEPRNVSPTQALLLRNMVVPGQLNDEFQAQVASECAKYGTVWD